jgi:signal transduction histidine kinase
MTLGNKARCFINTYALLIEIKVASVGATEMDIYEKHDRINLQFCAKQQLKFIAILLIRSKMKTSVRNIVLFSIFLLSSLAAYTQSSRTDSLKKVLAAQKEDTAKVRVLGVLAWAYAFSYPDTGLVYAKRALSLSEELNYDYGKFWSIVGITRSLYALGNYHLQLEYAFKAVPIAKNLDNLYTTGWSKGMLADCYYNLGEYNTSLRYYREVIKIVEQSYPNERFAIYHPLSAVFAGLREYDSALLYAKKGYQLLKHNSLFDKEDRRSKWVKSGNYTSLGEAFFNKGYYDSALVYYSMSLPFSKSVDMRMNKIKAYIGIAKLYREKGILDSAILYAEKTINERSTKIYPAGMLQAANLLVDMYEEKEISDSTLKYLRMASAVKDSLFNKEKTIAFQNTIFKEQEKQREIADAKSKLRTQFIMYFSLAALVAVLVIASIVVRNNRQKQLQNMRNSIADDLHDDIGSTLSSISIMSELAKTKLPEASTLLTSIGESTASMQENMSDIVWAIKSENDRFENVLHRMNQFASEIFEAKNIELDFSSDASLLTSRLTMKQRKNLYLFFKEIVNNAAKYSDAKKVSVHILQKEHQVEMNIHDNGKGFDTTKKYTGNGMSTLKKRVEELNGYFKIQSQLNEGTVVQLKFNIS